MGSAGKTIAKVAEDAVTAVSLGGATIPLDFAKGGAFQGIKNAFTDIGGAKYAAGEESAAISAQTAQSTILQNQLLEQPKQISPDNFLATKTAQLANLKLGLASTVTGAAGAPSPVLSSTSLTANGAGKTKLGQ